MKDEPPNNDYKAIDNISNIFYENFQSHKLSFNVNQKEPTTPSFNVIDGSPHNYFMDNKDNFKLAFSFSSLSHNNYLNSALTIKLSEIENKITKFNDFKKICFFLILTSITCFFFDLYIFSQGKDNLINLFGKDFGPSWYWLGKLICNLIHCMVYMYGLISYNHQSSDEITHTHLGILLLILLNTIFFIIFIFYVSVYFITFCINSIFFISNLMLIYQASELTKLFNMKNSLMKNTNRVLSMSEI